MRMSDWSSDVCSSDLELRGVGEGCGPLVLVGLDVSRHRRIQVGADAEAVVEDDLAQAVEAALQLLQPRGRPLQPVVGADVVHEVELGRATCRERVCQSVEISVVEGSLQKKNKK